MKKVIGFLTLGFFITMGVYGMEDSKLEAGINSTTENLLSLLPQLSLTSHSITIASQQINTLSKASLDLLEEEMKTSHDKPKQTILIKFLANHRATDCHRWEHYIFHIQCLTVFTLGIDVMLLLNQWYG